MISMFLFCVAYFKSGTCIIHYITCIITCLCLLLQAKRQQIKTNFHDTVKVQQKQYKSLQKHLTNTLPKEKQKEVLRPLKEEQLRKMALLALQYERTIDEVLQQQTVIMATPTKNDHTH